MIMLSIDNMFNYAVQLQVNTHLCTQKWIEKCLAFTRHSINLSACIQAGRKKTERKSMNRIESHAPVSFFTWRYNVLIRGQINQYLCLERRGPLLQWWWSTVNRPTCIDTHRSSPIRSVRMINKTRRSRASSKLARLSRTPFLSFPNNRISTQVSHGTFQKPYG